MFRSAPIQRALQIEVLHADQSATDQINRGLRLFQDNVTDQRFVIAVMRSTHPGFHFTERDIQNL